MNSRPQLAIFLPGLYGGGAERSMLNLASGFAERGVSVDLIVGVMDGPLQNQIPHQVSLVPFNARRTLNVGPTLVKYLRQRRPPAMLTALNRANLMALWARKIACVPTRIVISERNSMSLEAQNGQSFKSRIYPLLGRLFYAWADEIVAVSASTADDLAKQVHIARERITVIGNPIVTPLLQAKRNESIAHPWFGPDQPPVILSVGRLSPQKDMQLLINAFAHLYPKHPARLMILGEGPLRPQLEELVRTFHLDDVVSLPGWVSNPIAYMRQSAVFVLCSRWEGLPGVLIEAMYAGVPVVATDAPGGAKEILQNGKYGTLVPVGDINSLADALCSVLSGEKATPPPDSWRSFSIETVLDSYAAVLGL